MGGGSVCTLLTCSLSTQRGTEAGSKDTGSFGLWLPGRSMAGSGGGGGSDCDDLFRVQGIHCGLQGPRGTGAHFLQHPPSFLCPLRPSPQAQHGLVFIPAPILMQKIK